MFGASSELASVIEFGFKSKVIYTFQKLVVRTHTRWIDCSTWITKVVDSEERQQFEISINHHIGAALRINN